MQGVKNKEDSEGGKIQESLMVCLGSVNMMRTVQSSDMLLFTNDVLDHH